MTRILEPAREGLAEADGAASGNPARVYSAAIDFVVWWLVVALVFVSSEELLRPALGIPGPAGPDPRDALTIYFVGFGVVCANLYLAVSNGRGRSIGKALTGLRLIARGAHPPAKPGFLRGFVRSAVTAPPYLGLALAAAGPHDAMAGTSICRVSDDAIWDGSRFRTDESALASSTAPGIALWKIVVAVLVHAVVPFFYMIVAAL
jgi:uncharacterized RDD family membrane protein YckC